MVSKIGLKFLVFALVLGSLVYAAFAATGPVAPGTVTVPDGSSSRYNLSAYSVKTVQALAGNLTNFQISTITQTQVWAGFYGNVTGTITLDNAQNWTLFSWVNEEPTGIVYAVNQTIADWSTAHCLNFTSVNQSGTVDNETLEYRYDGGTRVTNVTGGNFTTLEELEARFRIVPDQVDGVDETFNYSNSHNGFFVGDTEVLAGDCAAVSTYQHDQPQNDNNFQEILLAVNNSEAVIFATIVENKNLFNSTDRQGWDNQTWDFQMLVLEDGKSGDEAVSPYYIYVELA